MRSCSSSRSMPRGRARASAGMAEPHWVQKAAGGVDRWQVGQRISPGLGVAMSRALCLPRPLIARASFGTIGRPCTASTWSARAARARRPSRGPRRSAAHAVRRARRIVLGTELDAGPGGRVSAAGRRCGRRRRWVIDGGYAAARDITWARIDAVVWLDYPMPLSCRAGRVRTVHRIRPGGVLARDRQPGERCATPSGRMGCCGGSSEPTAGAAADGRATARRRPTLRVIRLRSPDAAGGLAAGALGARALPLAAVSEALALPDREPLLDGLDDEPIGLVGLGPMPARP